MHPVDIRIRYADQNYNLEKLATLTRDHNLIFNDHEGAVRTAFKFALLTAASPLFALARLVRSAVFLFTGDPSRAFSEFIGAIMTPFVAAGCLLGTLFSLPISIISPDQIAYYVTMRRTYAYFEAFVNGFHLQQRTLPSYSQRVSSAFDFAGSYPNNVWTTAPCMQPVLESGFSRHGGLLDPNRMQKLFPFIKVNDIEMEDDQIVIQSEHESESVHYVACNGAFEHAKEAFNLCCCYRIEAVYDRVLCCEVGQGSCTSLDNSGDTCGIVSCSMCGCVGACCCYAKEDGQLTELNAGCFGADGIYIAGFSRVDARYA